MPQIQHDADERLVHADNLASALQQIAADSENTRPEPGALIGLAEALRKALQEAGTALEAERRQAAE